MGSKLVGPSQLIGGNYRAIIVGADDPNSLRVVQLDAATKDRLGHKFTHALGQRSVSESWRHLPVAPRRYAHPVKATISQRELRNDSGAIMRRVERGEAFIVTRNGVPVADLVPHDAAAGARPERFVAVDAVAAGIAALPTWGAERFRAELAELDDALDDRDVDRWPGRR